VASGTFQLDNVIQIIMGANIGTTVTNIIVSMVHITRKLEFKNAVVYALLTVYFRRIGAHLVNVSSSAISPFEKVQYVDNYKELSDI